MACEGTRFTESKRIESMKYGRTKGLPELKYHLLPRTKGLMMVLQGAKDKSTRLKQHDTSILSFVFQFLPSTISLLHFQVIVPHLNSELFSKVELARLKFISSKFKFIKEEKHETISILFQTNTNIDNSVQ